MTRRDQCADRSRSRKTLRKRPRFEAEPCPQCQSRQCVITGAGIMSSQGIRKLHASNMARTKGWIAGPILADSSSARVDAFSNIVIHFDY